uniref:SEA domain-containing protein n=1 Tax=Branchiostoma floridae TaxID=7739 RepID=C3YHR8_BRAFL|eukprot:XP_002604044.1 hypothetical protein BRAFLDRAFT_71666 [Branchiostoma floridae]
MRPSGGVLYLFLALTVVSAAPGHPLARRSIVVDFNLKHVGDANVADAENQASKTINDMMNNQMQNALDSVDVPAELVDVTVSGNDDTGDVTSPGPGDADPERASTDSVTLS